jgi:hypothetical protein
MLPKKLPISDIFGLKCLKKYTEKLCIRLFLAMLTCVRRCIQKFPDSVDNEINNNNKQSLRNDTKGYGSKTH